MTSTIASAPVVANNASDALSAFNEKVQAMADDFSHGYDGPINVTTVLSRAVEMAHRAGGVNFEHDQLVVAATIRALRQMGVKNLDVECDGVGSEF